jgi:hypothetical protein
MLAFFYVMLLLLTASVGASVSDPESIGSVGASTRAKKAEVASDKGRVP